MRRERVNLLLPLLLLLAAAACASAPTPSPTPTATLDPTSALPSGCAEPAAGTTEGAATLHCLESTAGASEALYHLEPYVYDIVRGCFPSKPCFGPFEGRAAAEATGEWLGRRVRRPGLLQARPLRPAELTRTRAGGRIFLGAPADLAGNLQLGPNETISAPGRDAVAIFYQDSFEGEPGPGLLWVLDGPTGRVHRLTAWDFAFAPDGRHVVFGRPHLTSAAYEGDGEAPDTAADAAREARAAAHGVPKEQLAEAEFTDGFEGALHAVRPVLLDLDTGRQRPLPLAGGGTLARHGDLVVALPRPWYYEAEVDEAATGPERARALAYGATPPRWVSLSPDVAATAFQALGPDLDPPLPAWKETVGAFIARTGSGDLGLLFVGPDLGVQPVRVGRGTGH